MIILAKRSTVQNVGIEVVFREFLKRVIQNITGLTSKAGCKNKP